MGLLGRLWPDTGGGADHAASRDADAWASRLGSRRLGFLVVTAQRMARPGTGRPRSIRALVAADPGAVFMFVLSKNYLRACGADLAAACEQHHRPGPVLHRVGWRQAGRRPGRLHVPADARLQAHFGGTRRALNARIGADLLERGIRSKDEAVRVPGTTACRPAAHPALQPQEAVRRRDPRRHHRPPSPSAGNVSQPDCCANSATPDWPASSAGSADCTAKPRGSRLHSQRQAPDRCEQVLTVQTGRATARSPTEATQPTPDISYRAGSARDRSG